MKLFSPDLKHDFVGDMNFSVYLIIHEDESSFYFLHDNGTECMWIKSYEDFKIVE
jgi:hypothetical protein